MDSINLCLFEVIVLEHFSAPTQTETATTPRALTRHAVFQYFLSDDIKQYSETTNAHIKRLI